MNGSNFISDHQRKHLIKILLRTVHILLLIINENNLFEIYYKRPKFYFWLSTKTIYPKLTTNGPNFNSDYQRKQVIQNLLRTAQILLLIISENNLSEICWNPAHGEVYSIQHYVIKFVRNFRKVDGFLRVPRFPPLIKLAATK
jgi:hypothetical protein